MSVASALVIGCGSIGSRHARNLAALGAGQIVVYDPDFERRDALAREIGGQTAATLEEAWAGAPEAVFVCAPSSMHVELAREALERGADVFVEKPLAHTLDGVDELIERAEGSERVFMVAYNLRFHPALEQARAWLDEGRIGRVVSARLHCGEHLPSRHPWEDYRVGYGARADLGGGVLLDAIHELDYALWLFGPPRAVFCMGGRLSSLEIETDDVAEVLLDYGTAPAVSVHLDYLQRPPGRWCELIGEDGTIRCDLRAREAALFAAGAGEWETHRAAGSVDDDYVRELEHFLAARDGGPPPPVDAALGRLSLELALAARTSASSGQVVALPLDTLRA